MQIKKIDIEFNKEELMALKELIYDTTGRIVDNEIIMQYWYSFPDELQIRILSDGVLYYRTMDEIQSHLIKKERRL